MQGVNLATVAFPEYKERYSEIMGGSMMGACRSFGFRRSVLLLAIWAASQTVFAQDVEIATSVAFTEGPAVDSGGNVYFTDIINQRIMKLSKEGSLSIYREKSNVANGLLIDPQGRLIA